jgi:hypothetical protein
MFQLKIKALTIDCNVIRGIKQDGFEYERLRNVKKKNKNA